MREALVIFRKDVRHLWPLGAAVSAIVVFHGWIDLQYEYSYLKTLNTRWHDYEPLLLFVAWWCLVGVLMQQERTVGDRQYWLTRPISRGAVISAKALFLVTFICVPSLLTQTVVLGLTGFPLANNLAPLIWNQVLIFCYFVMAGALAAIARNFREYAVTSLAIVAGFAFLEILVVNREGGQWEGVQWAQEAGSQLAILAASATVLAMQYRSRRIALARLIEGAGIAVTLLLLSTNWWHTAFAITSLVGGHASWQQIRIAFDADTTPAPGPSFPPVPLYPVRIAIPVRVSGIPHGREFSTERVSVTLNGSGAANWNSSWRVSSLMAAGTTYRNMDEWLAADGPYWLSFNIPPADFDRVKDHPASLRANIALAEFASPIVTPLPAKPRQYPVPEVGHCGLDTVGSTFTEVSCVMPFDNRAAVDFFVQPHDGGKPWEASGCCTISFVRFNTAGSFSLWRDVGSMPTGSHHLSPVDNVSVEMRRPVSFFEREITIADLQLARYEVAR